VAERHQVGPEFSALMDLEDVKVRSQFIRREHLRPVNQFGLTHLSFNVDDVDASAAAIEAAGGRVLSGTATDLAFGEVTLRFLYCTDPDGTRIELMDLGG
jgi:predicted enzyme related to lactoylglutathione lyase